MVHTPIGRERDPRYNRNAIVDRRQFERELFDASGNPTPVMYAFAGRMQMEVGSQGPEAQMAFAESVFNRAAARGHTLDYELRNHGRYSYWPQRQSDPGSSRNPTLVNMITRVCRNGTNISLGATGNDGVNDGINTSSPTVFSAGGERFNVELADRRWHANEFARLIRGVGRFIGDVAGAIGEAVGAVVQGVAEVGRVMLQGLGELLSPRQHSERPQPDHHPERMPPRYAAPRAHQPTHHVELRPRMEEPPRGGWRINLQGAPRSVADNQVDTPPDHTPRV